MTVKNLRLRILIAFAAVYLIWGSTFLAIRIAIETIPPFLMAAVRFLLAGGILYGVVCFRQKERPNANDWKRAAGIGAFLFLGGNGGVVWAQKTVPSGITALMIATVPLWMVLLNWFFFERKTPNPGTLFGVLMGFAGIWILAGPAPGHPMILDPAGGLLLIFAAFSWAVGSLYSRKTPLAVSAFMATSMKMITGGLWLLAAAIVSGEWTMFRFSQISPASLAALAYLVFFGALVGFTAYMWLLKMTTPARATTYAYVNPVIAVFLGSAFAGEPLTSRVLLGAAMIVVAVIIIAAPDAEA